RFLLQSTSGRASHWPSAGKLSGTPTLARNRRWLSRPGKGRRPTSRSTDGLRLHNRPYFGFKNGLHVNGNDDLAAHDDAGVLHRAIPVHAEVVAVEPRL